MNKKMKEMRSMSEPQLNERLSQLRMELVKFNTQVATGTTPKSPGLIKQAKKNIARIMTLLHELQSKKAAADSSSKAAKPAEIKPEAKPTAKKTNKTDKTGGVDKKQ